MSIVLGDLEYGMLYQHTDRSGVMFRMFRPSPFICYFCGEPITVVRGLSSDAKVVHSLDGNHDNWDPDNKVLAHNGCHHTFHCKGIARPDMMDDKNPMKRSEVRDKVSEALSGEDGGAKKAWDTRRKRYGPSGMKDLDAFRNMMKGVNKQTWMIRRERYGPSGRRSK